MNSYPNKNKKNGSFETFGLPAVHVGAVTRGIDSPSQLSSVSEAVEAIREGKLVLVVDDEDRENEGDLIMAGSMATPEAIAFMLRHCSGLICCPTSPSILDRLSLPLMVPPKSNSDAYRTAFTVPVDYLEGCKSGLSAAERSRTILAIGSPDSRPEDFRRPGHIFPLSSRPFGVLQRAGHTEAAVDLAVLAGLPPVGVLCEVVNSDGSMSRLPQLKQLAEKEGLCLISIADLIRYRLERESVLVPADVADADVADADVANDDVAVSEGDRFRVHRFDSLLDGTQHLALTLGDVSDSDADVIVYVIRERITEQLFLSNDSENFSKTSTNISANSLNKRSGGKGEEWREAVEGIRATGRGVIVCLQGREGTEGQEGEEEEEEAALEAGEQSLKMRAVAIGGQILLNLGVRNIIVQNGDLEASLLENYVQTCRHRFGK